VSTFEQVTDPARLYMSLTIDHPAVTLSTVAPYNTVALTATPRDALGHPMTGLPVPTFTVLGDPSKVQVSADGIVTALNTTANTLILASLTAGPITHVDTAWIQVTNVADPPQLDTLSIDPLPPDSAVWSLEILSSALWNWLGRYGLGIYPDARVVARTVSATGSHIEGLTVVYTSLDPAIATLGGPPNNPKSGDRRSGWGILHGRPGQVRIVAQAMAYGISRADTATFTVTMPVAQNFYIRSGANGIPRFVGITVADVVSTHNEVRIAPYGIVGWFNQTTDPVDIVFDDPTNVTLPPAYLCDALEPDILGFAGPYCGEGNVSVAAGDGSTGSDEYWSTSRFRQFPVPGIYPFHDARTGATGRVVVGNDPT
jgi:hypothetical protein